MEFKEAHSMVETAIIDLQDYVDYHLEYMESEHIDAPSFTVTFLLKNEEQSKIVAKKAYNLYKQGALFDIRGSTGLSKWVITKDIFFSRS